MFLEAYTHTNTYTLEDNKAKVASGWRENNGSFSTKKKGHYASYL